MKRWLLKWYVILALPTTVEASALTLSWQPVPDATKYTIYQSVDAGASWTKVADTTSPYLLVEAPDTGLVMYYVASSNAKGETANRSRGVWFNWLWSNVPSRLVIQ